MPTRAVYVGVGWARSSARTGAACRQLLSHQGQQPEATGLSFIRIMGLVLGRYELIRRLAVGGMGEVFLARQVGVGGFSRLAIVKTLLPELAASPAAVQDFLDEARLSAILNHPNIVSVFDVGEHDGTYFIAMEYVEGADLAALRRAAAERGVGIPYMLIARIGADAARALDHAHTQRVVDGQRMAVVHRDVSPQNLMVRLDGVTKVVDFGIAKVSSRGSRTATGQVKGKVRYLAPEQLTEQATDPRSDQYALGVVLWELATGRLLYEGHNEFMLMQRIAREQVPAPRTLVPALPRDLDAIIYQMTSNERARRFATCGAAADAIDAFLARESEVSGPAAISGWLRDLVGAAVAARTADLTPAAAAELPRPVGAPTGDTNTTKIVTSPAGRRSSAPLVAAALAVTTVAALGIVMVLVRPQPAPSPAPVAPAPVVAAAPVAVAPEVPAAPSPAAPAVDPPAPDAPPMLPPEAAAPPVVPPTPVVSAPSERVQAGGPSTRPVRPRRVEVELRAPTFVQWRAGGRVLGKGAQRPSVAADTTSVTAVDTRTGGVSEVRLQRGVADWNQLGRGKLAFRVLPFAEVHVGNTALGLTPVPPQELVEGTYPVRLVYKDRVERRSVVVKTGAVADVVHDFR